MRTTNLPAILAIPLAISYYKHWMFTTAPAGEFKTSLKNLHPLGQLAKPRR
jgi:hypothetical protein